MLGNAQNAAVKEDLMQAALLATNGEISIFIGVDPISLI
jgi:hypothetical protein